MCRCSFFSLRIFSEVEATLLRAVCWSPVPQRRSWTPLRSWRVGESSRHTHTSTSAKPSCTTACPLFSLVWLDNNFTPYYSHIYHRPWEHFVIDAESFYKLDSTFLFFFPRTSKQSLIYNWWDLWRIGELSDQNVSTENFVAYSAIILVQCACHGFNSWCFIS